MTEKEIKFCDFMERNILSNRNNVSYENIRTAAGLIDYRITGTCPTCYKNYGLDLLSKYNELESEYNEYKSSKDLVIKKNIKK